MFEIVCRVCNNIFQSKKPQYKNCSPECAKVYKSSYDKSYVEAHKEEISKAINTRHENNPNQRKKYARTSYLNQHSVDENWYAEKMEEQKGYCALCETKPTKVGLHIDHRHTCCNFSGGSKRLCGKCTRGLLCSACNVRLGYLEDTFKQIENSVCPAKDSWLEKAITYIKDYDIV